MTTAGVEALRADHAALVEMAGEFTDEEWVTPSACEGWAVRDVVAHLTQLWRQVVDPGALPPPDPSGNTERTQDRWVEALQDTPTADLLAEYQALGDQAIAAMEALQGVDTLIDLGDLGSHPLDLVPNIFAFDHYTHIRVDLLAPSGPLEHPAPPLTDGHLDAIADWFVAAIPQMTPAAADQPIDLELVGLGRTERIGPEGEAVATVATSVPDLVLWGSHRASWRDLDVEVRGDQAAGERFLDTVHVF